MQLTDFDKLLELVNSQDDLMLQFATIGFRRLLSFEDAPPIQQVIDA